MRLAKSTGAVVTGLSGIDLTYIEAPMVGRVGANAYSQSRERSLNEQARDKRTRLKDAFELECRSQAISFEFTSFEGDPNSEIPCASETCDLVIAGHDTGFRGNIYEHLSEVIEKFAMAGPRPMIVCGDVAPASGRVLVAYDGRASSTRAIQMFALVKTPVSEPIKIMTISKNYKSAEATIARAAKYLRAHDYKVEELPIVSRLSPANILDDEVRKNEIGLLVIGACRQHRILKVLFESTMHRLLAGTVCSIFVYH